VTILGRERLARDLQEAGALVLHVAPRRLTLSLINRHLRIKAQRLLQAEAPELHPARPPPRADREGRDAEDWVN
jgi:hypothetical protein